MSESVVALAVLERPPTQSQLVYDQLRSALRSAQVQGGSLLTESDLSRQLGVSTTPVHEAMVRLASEGFVELLPRRGVRVVRLTIQDIEEIFEVREALEGEVTRLAQERMTPSGFTLLETHLRNGMRGVHENDYASFNASDNALHDCVAQIANNRRLIECWGSFGSGCSGSGWQPSRISSTFPAGPKRPNTSTQSWWRPCDKRTAAESIVRRHIASLREDIVAHMASEGLDSI